MNPTPLVPGGGKDLFNSPPEAERAVADGAIRRDLEATPLDIDEEFVPALRALSHTGLEADEFFLAFGCGANQHQHAFGAHFHSRLQVCPVRPDVQLAPCRVIAFLPSVVFGLRPCGYRPGGRRSAGLGTLPQCVNEQTPVCYDEGLTGFVARMDGRAGDRARHSEMDEGPLHESIQGCAVNTVSSLRAVPKLPS